METKPRKSSLELKCQPPLKDAPKVEPNVGEKLQYTNNLPIIRSEEKLR